ncbi:hypothetical protein V6678_19195, partial [Enterobacter hormaechei]|uniref:hypothetical protein n=1 Tax=Enterobacter hormaechei TaxID=158836 RepID=UPI003306A9C2
MEGHSSCYTALDVFSGSIQHSQYRSGSRFNRAALFRNNEHLQIAGLGKRVDFRQLTAHKCIDASNIETVKRSSLGTREIFAGKLNARAKTRDSIEVGNGRFVLMNPLMILVKIIKLRWIHILSYDQM